MNKNSFWKNQNRKKIHKKEVEDTHLNKWLNRKRNLNAKMMQKLWDTITGNLSHLALPFSFPFPSSFPEQAVYIPYICYFIQLILFLLKVSKAATLQISSLFKKSN